MLYTKQFGRGVLKILGGRGCFAACLCAAASSSGWSFRGTLGCGELEEEEDDFFSITPPPFQRDTVEFIYLIYSPRFIYLKILGVNK